MAIKTFTRNQFAAIANPLEWKTWISGCDIVDQPIRGEFGGTIGVSQATSEYSGMSITYFENYAREDIRMFSTKKNSDKFFSNVTALPLGKDAWEISGFRVVDEKNIPLAPWQVAEMLPTKFREVDYNLPSNDHYGCPCSWCR